MGEKYLVEAEKLTDIADAIRLKTDSTTPMTLDDMPLQISLIEGEGFESLFVSQCVATDSKTLVFKKTKADINIKSNKNIHFICGESISADDTNYVINKIYKLDQSNNYHGKCYRPNGTFFADFDMTYEGRISIEQDDNEIRYTVNVTYDGYDLVFQAGKTYTLFVANTND